MFEYEFHTLLIPSSWKFVLFCHFNFLFLRRLYALSDFPAKYHHFRNAIFISTKGSLKKAPLS